MNNPPVIILKIAATNSAAPPAMMPKTKFRAVLFFMYCCHHSCLMDRSSALQDFISAPSFNIGYAGGVNNFWPEQKYHTGLQTATMIKAFFQFSSIFKEAGFASRSNRYFTM